MSETVVHIQWEGPFSVEEAIRRFNDRSEDCGLYQVYGHHPVYGSGTLLYIGKTCATFAERFSQGLETGETEDRNNIEIYLGRLKGEATPSRDVWNKQIELAEKLLIHSHGPAYNTEYIRWVPETDPEVCNVRVLNWGSYRALHPEVSGRRWTKGSTEEAGRYRVYKLPCQSAPEELR